MEVPTEPGFVSGDVEGREAFADGEVHLGEIPALGEQAE